MGRSSTIAVLTAALLASGCGASTSGVGSASPLQIAQNQTPATDESTEIPSDNETPANSATLVSKSYTSSDAALLNPERGFYYWTDLLTSDFSNTRSQGYTLIYARLLLSNFREKSLDELMLNNIRAALLRIRQAGVKCILRVVYDDTSGGEDAALGMILEHINQLKPILTDNADVIYVMQAGFIGAWGEWHTSSNGLDNDAAAQKQILDAIAAALPESRHMQVRTPLFKNAYATLGGNAIDRIGHHNDCFLASDTDYGTYPSDAIAFWKNNVANDARVLVGGETCNTNSPRTDCESALQEMTMLHYSFLNGSPWGGVIDEWKSQGCYDSIYNQLGYRFELQSAELNERVRPGKILHVKFTLKNSGFASLQYARGAHLLLKSGEKTYAAPVAFDLSTIAPAATASVEVNATLPADITEGSYTLSLWMPDSATTLKNNSLYDIQLANKDGNQLSNSIVIDSTAGTYSGTANSSFQLQ